MKEVKNNKIPSFIFYILLMVASLIGFFAFCVGIAFIQEKIFIKGEYFTLMTKSPYSKLIFLILILVMTYIAEIYWKSKRLTKYIFPIIIFLTYIIVTSVTVVSKEGIIDYSFYNLKGEKYEFSQVVNVNTGFIDSGRHRGEFFYNIELKDGKKFKLAYPSLTQPSKQYDDDTWKEYVDIDKLIMDTGAKKESSENGSKYVSMDKIYVDKLLQVIRNTN